MQKMDSYILRVRTPLIDEAKQKHKNQQAGISQSYSALNRAITPMRSAKDIQAYLTDLGFDLSEEFPDEEKTVPPLDQGALRYLFAAHKPNAGKRPGVA